MELENIPPPGTLSQIFIPSLECPHRWRRRPCPCPLLGMDVDVVVVFLEVVFYVLSVGVFPSQGVLHHRHRHHRHRHRHYLWSL